MIQRQNFYAAVLSAGILSMVVCPVLYIAIGALRSFAAAFSFTVLPLFLGGGGFLLWRFVAKPKPGKASRWMWVMEGFSWLGIMTFVVLVSGFNLMKGIERFGLYSTFLLISWLACLPLMWQRNTALKQRLSAYPRQWLLGINLLLLIVAVVTMALFLVKDPSFI